MKKLPEAELEIMNVLWREDRPLKTSEIAEFCKQNNWTMSTIQALLARLLERKFVTLEKDGRIKYYQPLVKENEYKSQETVWFLNKVHNNSMKSLVTSLIDSTKLTKSDIDELEEILKKAGK
ncbi:BlaI/MecI/CopY family transcriptional regulator [Anaerorhabdus furcosa]|uniref:Penicillinase repressor n=1 Tax=Anaerorhabdus furcosa TaxID=118967 RepID=A0A1T4NA35_9FIRM|nr:BlaI/MecI/CopY family transcriptional regulator [Anaerorhabdus furcosa]SJZ76092.1 Penicillinase repressor [Anaerorhabdus furcosa]